MEQPKASLPEPHSTPIPVVPPAKSALEQAKVSLPESPSTLIPVVPPAKSVMEQPKASLPEPHSHSTPIPVVPSAESVTDQPKASLPPPGPASSPVPQVPPAPENEQPKVTVQLLEDSASSSSSELEDKSPPGTIPPQASQGVEMPSAMSSGSCSAVGMDAEKPPESDHPSGEVGPAEVPQSEEHPEEARPKPAPMPSAVEDPEEQRCCIVDLERGAISEKWGFQWDREAMDKHQRRVISAVAANSLAEVWNRRFPGRAVRKGHRLVKVNGLEDHEGIAAELKKKQITCHFEVG